MALIKIILNDSNMTISESGRYFRNAGEWAEENCPGFVGYEIVDVSDFSITQDSLCEYQFEKQEGAIMFSLKWT